MKTLRTLGLALLVGLLVIGAATAAPEVTTISVPATSTVGPGGDVVVPVSVNAASGMVSLQLAIGYNPAVLTPTGVYKTSFGDSFELEFNVVSPGDLRISMFGVTPINGTGEMCWIVFHAVGANGSSSSLSFTQAEVNEVPTGATGGTVSVTAAASVISMPDTAGGANGVNVAVPVVATPANGFIAVDLDVRWNALILTATSVTAAGLPGDWSVFSSLTPGRAQVSIFGVTPLAGTVPLVNVHYQVLGSYGQQTPLDITRGDANEGNITTSLDDGLFTVNCDDVNACTNDSYNGVSCVHTPVSAGTACGSGSDTACDNPDTCDGSGNCQSNNEPSGTACGSPSNTDCDNPDTCNGSGTCQSNNEPSGTSCTADSNTCTADQCNGSGTCAHPTLPNGTACDDLNPCTQTDTCSGGTCVGSNPVVVAELNASVHVTQSGPVTTISWTDPPGAYDVYRGTRSGVWSYNQVCLDGPTQNSYTLDAFVPGPGVTFYYLVSRRTACGESVLGHAYPSNAVIPNTHPCTYPDFDNDGVQDKFDNCPVTANSNQSDVDGDAVGDVCDNCPSVPNPGQQDTDHDGTGNVCDPTPLTQGGAGMQAPGGSNIGAGSAAGESVDPHAAPVARVFLGVAGLAGECGESVRRVVSPSAAAPYTLAGGA